MHIELIRIWIVSCKLLGYKPTNLIGLSQVVVKIETHKRHSSTQTILYLQIDTTATSPLDAMTIRWANSIDYFSLRPLPKINNENTFYPEVS